MKCVILAGGMGTRISEETSVKPKPMIEIGGRPILWHIMKLYSAHSINDFVVCLGYKGYVIKEYFSNYFLHMSDVTFDFKTNSMQVHSNQAEPWTVTLVDTGNDTQTGGRLKRVLPHLDEDNFCFTYGDGLADVDISSLISFHLAQNRLATLTAVQPPGRFGALHINGSCVTRFAEKPQGDGGWINGGFFVLNRRAVDYIDGDDCAWEQKPVQRLADEGQLCAYQHMGFWHAMDTLRDKSILERLWESGAAPWKVWP